MGPKYEFTDEKTYYEGYYLYRIRRLSDGKLGGWIESENNLSQEGNCWVDNMAMVYDDARISGNAQVYDKAEVHGDAKVSDNACVKGNAKVWCNAQVYNNAQIYGNADVQGNAVVCDNAQIYDDAKVYAFARVYGDAKVFNYAHVFGNAEVYDNTEVYGNAYIYGDAEVYGNAHIYGNAKVYNYAEVHCDAHVYDEAEIYGNANVHGNAKVYGGTCVHNNAIVYGNADLCFEKDNIIEYGNYKGKTEDSSKEIVQDFIYKVDDSNKITAQTEYDSVDEFFSESVTNNIKLDTLVICTVDTKEPLIKLQKIEIDNKINFKFIVEITNSDGDDFIIRTTIKSQDQLNELIQQTVEALKLYPKFSKYADTLEECL